MNSAFLMVSDVAMSSSTGSSTGTPKPALIRLPRIFLLPGHAQDGNAPLGYPTTDEFGLSDGIGRKQSFQRGHIYGSLAGLATIHGAIYDKWPKPGQKKAIGLPHRG